MTRPALMASVFALACAGSSDKSQTNPSPTDTAQTDTGKADEAVRIAATVRILNAMSGAGMEDVTVQNSAGETESTDSSGVATLSVISQSTFALTLEKEGALDHLLCGPTASEDFDYISFMATESLVSTVVSMLGTSLEEGTGLLVVGIDYDDLSPAVGASASIDAAHDDPWVLSSSGAAFGDTIPTNGMGMVAFSNVQPGDVSVSVTAPEGAQCTAYPSGGLMPDAPIEADVVTVVTFHCR
jgi:hypothetical protein